MAQISYRANLSAANWPFVSGFSGRTVIVQGNDQNYIRGLAPGIDGLVDEADRGIPQAIYMHNVMPSANGFQSVTTSFVNINNTPSNINFIFQSELAFAGVYQQPRPQWVAITAAGSVYLLSPTASTYTWSNLGITGVADLAGKAATSAHVNGTDYFHFAGSAVPLRVRDGAFPDLFFANSAFTGITFTPLGITASNGYMIVWDHVQIAWSSTATPTDFTPSLVTGAGTQRIQEVKGKIGFCVPFSLGFMIYSDLNVVAALYSGNAKYPFNFKELVGSGGCTDINLITYDSTASAHYSYTTKGMQLLDGSNVRNVMPELNEFIDGKYFEDYNTGTFTLTTTEGTTIAKKVNVAGNFLVISYGLQIAFPQTYTYALVYNMASKKWGKFKLTHWDVLEFPGKTDATSLPSFSSLEQIAFIDLTGNVRVVEFQPNALAPDSVIMLGKYQYVRDQVLTLEGVEIETTKSGSGQATVYDITSADGKTAGTPIVGTAVTTGSGAVEKFAFHNTAINHTIMVLGKFYLSSVQLIFHLSGHR